MKTTKKMAPVTASTNRDNPKIDFAGVDAGAKMFVGLKGWAASASAVPEPKIRTTRWETRARQLLGPRDRNWTPFSGDGREVNRSVEQVPDNVVESVCRERREHGESH
jgi:hypothetical protein